MPDSSHRKGLKIEANSIFTESYPLLIPVD